MDAADAIRLATKDAGDFLWHDFIASVVVGVDYIAFADRLDRPAIDRSPRREAFIHDHEAEVIPWPPLTAFFTHERLNGGDDDRCVE